MILRTLEHTIRKAAAHFPVLLLTGPRQVGKTTLLHMCAEPERGYVSLDDLDARELARTDPALFIQRYPPPVTIDEVQYAPPLFPAIKAAVDRARRPDMFWLTGSQKFHLMTGITESLAGRVAVLDMLGLSRAEAAGAATSQRPFLPGAPWLAHARRHAGRPKPLPEVYADIWRGSFPQLAADPSMPRDLFYASYVQTAVQRDVRDILKIRDLTTFARFLRAVAARTGQLLNYSDIGRDVDIDHKTAKAWISVLETCGLVYLLPPYHSNVSKRLLKTPKIYFLDTGLCSHLTRWPSPEALEAGAMSGAILETYVFAEILKSYWHTGTTAYFSYYRDTDQREIDLVIEHGNALHPVEIKKTTTPGAAASRYFPLLARLGRTVGHGAVVCLREEDIPISRHVDAVPVHYI